MSTMGIKDRPPGLYICEHTNTPAQANKTIETGLSIFVLAGFLCRDCGWPGSTNWYKFTIPLL